MCMLLLPQSARGDVATCTHILFIVVYALLFCSEVDPISFELLYKDHLLYDNYNVGDILCDGDNISTQIITPHHSPSLTPVQPATSSINTKFVITSTCVVPVYWFLK